MIAPKHLRKLMMGGGDELGYQNIPEEGGHKRKDVGVDGEAHSLHLGRSSAASSAAPRPAPWSSQRRRRKDLRRWKTSLALVR